jgi:hypothetical protein
MIYLANLGKLALNIRGVNAIHTLHLHTRARGGQKPLMFAFGCLTRSEWPCLQHLRITFEQEMYNEYRRKELVQAQASELCLPIVLSMQLKSVKVSFGPGWTEEVRSVIRDLLLPASKSAGKPTWELQEE